MAKYEWAFNDNKLQRAIAWVNDRVTNEKLKFTDAQHEEAVKERYIALAGLVVDPQEVVKIPATKNMPATKKLKKSLEKQGTKEI